MLADVNRWDEVESANLISEVAFVNARHIRLADTATYAADIMRCTMGQLLQQLHQRLACPHCLSLHLARLRVVGLRHCVETLRPTNHSFHPSSNYCLNLKTIVEE